MRIIKKGNEKEFGVYCEKCRSDLSYTTGDVREVLVEHLGWGETRLTLAKADRLICPVCGNELIPSYKEIS